MAKHQWKPKDPYYCKARKFPFELDGPVRLQQCFRACRINQLLTTTVYGVFTSHYLSAKYNLLRTMRKCKKQKCFIITAVQSTDFEKLNYKS